MFGQAGDMRVLYRSGDRRREVVVIGVVHPREILIDDVAFSRVGEAVRGSVEYRIDPMTDERVLDVAENIARTLWDLDGPDGVRSLLLGHFDNVDSLAMDVAANLLRDMADYGGADVRRIGDR